MLEMYGVRAGYGRLPVLFDIDLTIDPGEMVAVNGPNGAGKSTLLKTILGVLRPRQGTVVFDGSQVAHEPPHARFARGIALAPEGRRIFKSLTVKENLVTGATGVEATVVADQTQRVFELFPVLAQRQRQLAGSLSGGEQQMLAISRALISAPSLLLIDELSLGLAPMVVAQLYETLRQLTADGLAIVVVDQFVSKRVQTMLDRTVVLEKGRIVFDGTQDQAQAQAMAAKSLGFG